MTLTMIYLVLTLTFCLNVCVVHAGSLSHIWKEHWQDADKCCSTDPDQPSNGCQQTSLIANQYIQAIITPGYPHGLPSHRQCTWTIQSKPGKRVRIDFRDFYLIGPNDGGECVEQFVMVLSSLKYKMGPFCGNTGLQSIVSPDNLVVVQLEVKSSKSTENYRGFRMEFTESDETPSVELRPPNWRNGKDMFLVGNQLQNAISQFGPTGQAPAATRVVPRRPITPTRPSSGRRNVANTKAGTNPLRPPQPNRPRRPIHYGPKQNNNNNNNYNLKNYNRNKKKKEETTSLLLPLEVIVGISVGGLVLLALIILIIFKLRQVCRKKAKSNLQSKAEIEPKSLAAQVYEQENQNMDHPVRIETPQPYPASNKQMSPPEYASLAPQLGLMTQDHSLPLYSHLQGQSGQYGSKSIENGKKKPTKIHDTLQQASSNQMMLYDPASGVYFNPAQLQAVQAVPQHPVQASFNGYHTMPYQGNYHNDINFMQRAATLQHNSDHRSGEQPKRRTKRSSASGKKKRSHKKKSRR